jgi:hypothetical protein
MTNRIEYDHQPDTLPSLIYAVTVLWNNCYASGPDSAMHNIEVIVDWINELMSEPDPWPSIGNPR